MDATSSWAGCQELWGCRGVPIGAHGAQAAGFPPSETFEQLGRVGVLGCSAHDGPVHFARSGFHSYTLEEVMQRSPNAGIFSLHGLPHLASDS